MYKVKIISFFSAAHYLRAYKGKCENLHGHNWRVEVVVSSEKLNKIGMVIDFSKLKKMTNNILSQLDHKPLNKIDFFKKNNPSSEEIARYIFLKLKQTHLPKNCYIEEVRIWETDTSCAIYKE
ncbi:MAG: 6-carboxytetrahydropterin synthase QueD [Candidatus Omnitrophica bacterium]|nr:6-carboxytetrahydropterin synthase QueD [Candidatus Omnitrophota bacterium]